MTGNTVALRLRKAIGLSVAKCGVVLCEVGVVHGILGDRRRLGRDTPGPALLGTPYVIIRSFPEADS